MNNHDLMTVNEVAKRYGITVRTLHYYDQIGLLIPNVCTQSNYRLYSYMELEKLQQILFFKEIGFELKQIKQIMSNPLFDHEDALKKHHEILLIKKKRIEDLIELVDKTLEGQHTNFMPFDNSEVLALQNKYYEEISARYKHTEQFKEFELKHGKKKLNNLNERDEKAKDIFIKFSMIINSSPDSDKAQELVELWQKYITENYYHCSKDMLLVLGDMYSGDERFVDYFNSICEGLDKFIYQAIQCYCKK